MKQGTVPSKSAQAAIDKLGVDIAVARKRRRLTQKRVSEGAGVSTATVRRLEKGDAGVSLGALAMVLLVLGESERLGKLIDIASDDIGMVISVNSLPRRVREKRKKSSNDDGRAGLPLPGYDSDGRFVGF